MVGAVWVYLRTQTDRANDQPFSPEVLNHRAFPMEVQCGSFHDEAIKQHVDRSRE